jgi:hypothetical protein
LNHPRISVDGGIHLYAVVFVQFLVVVDAYRVVRLPIWRVPGGTQWQPCKTGFGSIRSLRNGMPVRSGGLPLFASSNAAADGNAIAQKSSLWRTFATPSA